MHWHTWLRPELPQVDPRRRGYFEGWYYKLVDADSRVALALIPGVATGPGRRGGSASPEGHCFLQALSPQLALRADVRFPMAQYSVSHRSLQVSVGPCVFRRDGLRVNLDDGHQIEGELRFTDVVPFPARGVLRGPMGPFGWLPGMECYHGIVNVRHRIVGALRIDGMQIDFTGGTGYVEKDWGRSFPSAWVWLQGNHFEHSAACFLFSAAIIPAATGSFLGFFALLMDGGQAHMLATYNSARLRELRHDGNTVHALAQGRGGTLEVVAQCDAQGVLRAPKNGLMNRTIEESITAVLQVRWRDTHGNVIFDGRSPHGGMECCQTPDLLARLRPPT